MRTVARSLTPDPPQIRYATSGRSIAILFLNVGVLRALGPILHVRNSSFGEVRSGEVRFAADIPARSVGGRGKSADFVLVSGIPALLCAAASEDLGGQRDLPRDIWMLGSRGVDFLLKLNCMGRYVSSVVSFGKER